MKKAFFNGMPVIGFNTGRKYSPNGQRIIAIQFRTVFDDFWEIEYADIIFNDLDRGICGKISTSSFEERSIMRSYDNKHYENSSIESRPELKGFNIEEYKKILFGE